SRGWGSPAGIEPFDQGRTHGTVGSGRLGESSDRGAPDVAIALPPGLETGEQRLSHPRVVRDRATERVDRAQTDRSALLDAGIEPADQRSPDLWVPPCAVARAPRGCVPDAWLRLDPRIELGQESVAD